VATFDAESAFVTVVGDAIAGDNTVNLLLKRDNEALGGNHYCRFSDEDQPQPFRLEIDYLVTGGSGGNDFSDWIGGFTGLGGLTGLNDDADGDGIDNGVENFFGTNPGEFSQGLVAGAVDTGANTFTFTHPLNATPADDLTATYRWSTDLASFFNDGAPNTAGTTTVTFTPGTPSGGLVTVTAAITGSVIPEKLFVDVEVTQN